MFLLLSDNSQLSKKRFNINLKLNTPGLAIFLTFSLFLYNKSF